MTDVTKKASKISFVIPALDIIDGKCVRLEQGDFEKLSLYSNHPLDVAKMFEDAGLARLHLVDLDGARTGRVRNWKVLESIAAKTGLVIDFGGGIQSGKDVEIVLNSGAAMVTVGSIAVRNEEEFLRWAGTFGHERFFLGADVKDEKIVVNGWQTSTDIRIYDFLEDFLAHGIQLVFCTDVGKDGKLEGPGINLYRNILEKVPGIHLVASGGVSTVRDLEELRSLGCKGAIVGKAIYEKRISLAELSAFNHSKI